MDNCIIFLQSQLPENHNKTWIQKNRGHRGNKLIKDIKGNFQISRTIPDDMLISVFHNYFRERTCSFEITAILKRHYFIKG